MWARIGVATIVVAVAVGDPGDVRRRVPSGTAASNSGSVSSDSPRSTKSTGRPASPRISSYMNVGCGPPMMVTMSGSTSLAIASVSSAAGTVAVLMAPDTGR